LTAQEKGWQVFDSWVTREGRRRDPVRRGWHGWKTGKEETSKKSTVSLGWVFWHSLPHIQINLGSATVWFAQVISTFLLQMRRWDQMGNNNCHYTAPPQKMITSYQVTCEVQEGVQYLSSASLCQLPETYKGGDGLFQSKKKCCVSLSSIQSRDQDCIQLFSNKLNCIPCAL
jgi:hypothetical protein